MSSRLIQRSMKKTTTDFHLRHMGQSFIEERLKTLYKHYYSIKGSHKELRNTAWQSVIRQHYNGHHSRWERRMNWPTRKRLNRKCYNDQQQEKVWEIISSTFLQPPLINEFGSKALTPAYLVVLHGILREEESQNEHINDFLQFLAMPEQICQLGPQKMELSHEQYR